MKYTIFFYLALVSNIAWGKTYIACAVYCDAKGEESFFPNANTPYKSSSKQFQATYWRCATVMFATSKRYNQDATHLLFSNKHTAPEPYQSIFTKLGVEIVECPFSYKPPEGWYSRFRSSLYTLDCLTHLESIMTDDDICILLDADTIWIQNANGILEKIKQDGLLTYHVDYPAGHDINGVTRADYKRLYEEYYQTKIDAMPLHRGGEFIAANKAELKKIVLELPALWSWMLGRFEKKEAPIFNTEEHYVSFICSHMGHTNIEGNNFIKRIWTDARSYRNVDGSESNLTIWHMPAEKQLGIKFLFDLISAQEHTFFSVPLGKPFIDLCGRSCNIIT